MAEENTPAAAADINFALTTVLCYSEKLVRLESIHFIGLRIVRLSTYNSEGNRS